MGQRSNTETIVAILQAFLQTRTWKQADLARTIEISVAALRKHLNELSASGFPLERESLAKVEVPALVLLGGASHPAMQRANELLGQYMAKASTVTIAGAAHFMISTHVEDVARAIARHMATQSV